MKIAPKLRTLAAFSLLVSLVVPARAHNLDQRFTYINLSAETLDAMRERAAAGLPALVEGETIGIDLKSTPGPGTDTGVGGYITFYLPTDGTFQVVGAEYLAPDPGKPGYFRAVPMKGQSIIAMGNGSIGAASTTGLNGLTLGPNINGVTEAAVTAAGLHRGTIAGVYADTGIFYSTSPKTAWNSWANGTRPNMPGGGQYPILLKNNSGDEMRPRTYWDASQLIGFGLSGPHSPATDPNGRGNSPWGTANVVAGPQSGYAWDFSLDDWVAAGHPAYTNPALKNTLDQVGPWQRIQYPGSQVSKDQAGLVSNELGYAGVDASSLGHALSGSSPLPVNTTAVRFSVGMLELGRTEVARVYVKVLKPLTTCPFPVHGDAFGGDAGGEQGGKDHLWRYYYPTDEVINLCGAFQKSFSKGLVAPGDTVGVTLTYFNGSQFPATNLVITDPLPSGMTYVANTSKVDGIAVAPVSTSPMTWNLGYVAPYGIKTVTFDVVATRAGDYFNVATATTGSQSFEANDSLRAAFDDQLSWDKWVTPSAVAPGQTVTYTIAIDNNGTGPNGVPFVITEALPPGFTYQSTLTKQINGGPLPDSLFSVNASNPNKPVFTVGQGINAGQKLLLTFRVLVGSTVPPGTYYNSFQMGYEGKIVSTPPDAPVTVGGGEIGDTVWRDWNGDGVQNSGEEGISGVTVQLYRDNGTSPGVWDAGDTLLSTKVTDPDGRYVFKGLSDGSYIVKVDTTASVIAQHANTGDPDGGTANQAAVTLTGNSGTDLIDFGYRPGGSGTGTGSIGDKVFDDKDSNGSFGGTDVGINGVSVNLYEDSNGNGIIDAGDALIATTVTSGGGNYLFSNLAAGAGLDYIVDVVETDPDLTAYFTLQGKSWTPTTAGVYSVLNLAGASLTNDFGFGGVLPGSIGDTVFFDGNGDGLYTIGPDSPLVGVKVSLYFDANGDGVAQVGELVSTQDTDSTGYYRFVNLAPQRYIVVVDNADTDLPGGLQGIVPQYVVTLTSGQNFLTADFPFVELFTKTADKSTAAPGDIITYTLRLNLPGDQLYQDLVVYDPLPSGDVTYFGSSSGAVINGGYTPVAPVNGSKSSVSANVRDEFSSNGSYAGNNGTANWSGDWTESGDDNLANAGGILVTGNELRIDFNNVTFSSDGDFVQRAVNLAEAATASFTYTLQTNELDADEFIYVEVKGSGASWALVDTITLGTATGAKGSFNLKAILQAASQSLSSNTLIRFRRGAGTGNDQIEFDNIDIAYTTPATTTAITVSPTQVGSGGTATVTMTVGSDVAMTGVVPTALTPVLTGGATAALVSGPTPATASITAGGTAVFTWTYTLTDAASPAGTVKFTGGANGALNGAGSYAFATATSGTSQVIPAGSGTVSWNLGSHVKGSDGLRVAGATIYAFRGDGNGTDQEFWAYNAGTSVWNSPTDPTDYGSAVKGGGALTTDGTFIYGLRGNGQKTFQRYTIGSPGSWAALAPTPANIGNGGALAYHAANGKIYATRGGGKELYEFTLGVPGSWATKALVTGNFGDGGSLVSAGSYLYALRGGGQATFWRYEPATNTWITRANTPGNVDDGGSMVLVGSSIYAFQGKSNAFWRYDIATNAWTTLTAAPAAVGPGASMTAIGNTIYALRGNGDGTDTEFWRYSISSNSWVVDTSAPATVGWGGALVKTGTIQTYETELAVSPTVVSSGNNVTVTYKVNATEAITGFTPPATLNTALTGGATATKLAGPSPAGPVNIAANSSASFTYTYQVNAGAPPSGVVFSAPQRSSGTSATFPGGATWPATTADSVIAVPLLTMQVKVVNSPTGVLVDNVANFAGADKKGLDFCYVVADGLGATDTDTLLKITEGGLVERIGLTGTTHSEALVFSPDYTKLYTTDRDPVIGAGSDRFGTLDMTTGAFTTIGRIASSSNPLEGFLPGNIASNFSVVDVDGMSFNPANGKLYAVGRREGSVTQIDLLFQINPATGLHIEDAFGPGKDYIPVRTDLLTTPLYDIDDIAFKPGTSTLYAIANTDTISGFGDRLVTINLTTGAVTDIGRIQRSTNNSNVDDVEGLTFSSNGTLHATTGDSAPTGTRDSYWLIDPATAKATLTGSPSLNPIQTTPAGTEMDFEGVACFSDDIPIGASDNAVTSLTGAIGDLVWADANGDGNFDPTFAVIGGKIDIINDGAQGGVVNTNDDGILGGFRIIDGMVDINGDGAITGADNGTFQGIAVVGGILQSGVAVLGESGIPGVRVYVDTNGNGVYNSGEPSAITNAAGQYWIYGFTSGTYTVRYDGNTTPAGYLPTTLTSVSAVLPTNNSEFSTADFGLRPGPPSNLDSTIGDLVWVDSNGDGLYDQGEAVIPNVTVKLYLDLDNSGTLTSGDVQIGSKVTDVNGKYLFTGLQADKYLVVVDETDPDFPQGLALTGTSPAQPNPESVTLGVGEDKLTVDFAYAYTGSIGDFVWYDNNGNGVYEPLLGENGVPDATVLLYLDTNGNGSYDGGSDLLYGEAVTDAFGNYLFEYLPPGVFFVKVYEQSVAPEGNPSGPHTLLPTTDEKVKVTLAAGEAFLDADFGFKNGSFFEGHVYWDINHNGVFEPTLSGSPEIGLPDITVWIDANDNGLLDWTDGNGNNIWDEGEGEQWTVTDDEGEYKFFVGATGSYLVRYDINDANIPTALQGALAPTTPVERIVVVSVLGEEIEGIDFGRDNTGRIGDLIFGDRGTVGAYNGPTTDPGLAGVVVELYFDTDGSGTFDPVEDAYIATVTTNLSGYYLFEGLPDGTYFTNVMESSIPAAWQLVPSVDPTGALDGTGKATVTGGGAVLTMDFGYPTQQPGSISGTVFNDGGSAVGDGELNATVIDGFVDISRDGLINASDDGFLFGYEIIDGKVDVDGNGIIDTLDDITDASFDGKNVIDGLVDIVASGTITTADDGILSADTTIVGVVINLYDSTGAFVTSTVTDASGNYRFDGLRPGTYTVEEVNPTGFDSILDRAGLPADKAANIDKNDDRIPVTVTAGATSGQNNFLDDSADQSLHLVAISGQVRNDVDADGSFADPDPALSGVTIRLFSDLNGDGLTTLIPVIDGKLDLNRDGIINGSDTGTLLGLPIIAGQVDVNNDGVITATDDLSSFNGVAVIDGSLDIVPGGGITAADDGTIGSEHLLGTTTTNGSGNYSFTNLPFGSYVVVESDPTGANSTADVVGANDNQIGVVVSFGGKSGLDFLDTLLGTVSGHLYADKNGNGVQDVGEPNLAGVDMLIQDSTGRVQIVATDSSGNWTASVPPGTTLAAVVFSDPQFVAAFPSGFVQTDGTNPTVVIAVAATNTSMGNDGFFSPVATSSPASLAGKVYNDAGVAGFSGDDVPVPGVVVDLYLDTNGDRLVPFYAVIAGQIDLNGGGISATDDGTVLDYIVIDGKLDIDGNGSITTADDGWFNGIRVIDGKLDLNGDGVVNASDAGTIAGEPLVAQDVTTGSGSYSFSGLPAASYVVVEHDPAGSTSVDDRAAATEFPGADTDNQIGVVLSASEVSVGNDFLDSGVSTYTVSGFVLNDTDSTLTFSAGDTPIAVVTVGIYADFDGNGVLDPDELSAGPIATTITNLTGSYSFPGLPPGKYIVVETDPSGVTSITDSDAGANGPNQIAVTVTNADVTNRNFLDGSFAPAAFTGSVLADTNNDNVGDAGIIGVTLTLYTDPNGDGNPADGVALGTTTTASNGSYSFGNLVAGSYVVVQTQPAGYLDVSDGDLVADTPGSPADAANNPNDNRIAATLMAGETDGGNTFTEEQPGSITGSVRTSTSNEPIPGVTLTLLDAAGNPVDGDPNTPGIQQVTTVTAANGTYTFTAVAPGSYRVAETQPAGYYSISDKDGGNKDVIGDVTLIAVLTGQANTGNNFIEEVSTCTPTWAAWKLLHPGEEADGNPDGDYYDNLSEFAFEMGANSGAGDAFHIQPSEDPLAPGTIDAVFIRPTQATDNVTYFLEYTTTVGGIMVWNSIEITESMYFADPAGYCKEQITIRDLESYIPNYDGKGVVRIRAELDEDNDNTIDYPPSYTETEGWKETVFGICCQTYGTPYLRDTVFTGTVNAGGVSGQVINLSDSAGTTNLATLFAPGVSYFLEVTSGTQEGHRFDIISASGGTITLANDSSLNSSAAPYNTVTGPPSAALAGATVIVRRHWTVDEMFPPSGFVATGDQATADQLQLFAGGTWTLLHLHDDGGGTSRWVDNFNDLVSKGSTVIPPGHGLFFNNRNGVKALLSYGEIRENDFIRPLGAGQNLVSAGYPLNQSAAGAGSRNMWFSNGFIGTKDFKTADSFFIWKGDTTPGLSTYDTYYLLNGAPQSPTLLRWVKVGDATATNRAAELLLLENRAVFTRTAPGLPTYGYPAPWTP